MQLHTFVILVLLSCALSKPNEDYAFRNSKYKTLSTDSQNVTKITAKESPTKLSENSTPKSPVNNIGTNFTKEGRSDNSTGAIFIPELNQYDKIVNYVRNLVKETKGIFHDSDEENSSAEERNHENDGTKGVPEDANFTEEPEVPKGSRRNEELVAGKETTGKEVHVKSTINADNKYLVEVPWETGGNSSGQESFEEKHLLRDWDGTIPVGTSEKANRDNKESSKLPAEGINNAQTSYDDGKWEPNEEDLEEAANFGLKAMHDLYYVKEPKLHSMGLYLDTDNPARFVAAFNQQSEEARALSKYGFAVLQGATIFAKKFPGATMNLVLSRQRQGNPLQQNCPSRGIPDCPPASFRYRTSDGSCNNLQHLWWGSAMSTMQRFLRPVYQDGIQSVRRSRTGRPLPSAREISSIIHEDRDVPLASVTHMLMQWGQFVDHDLTATGQSRGFNGTVPKCCLDAGSGIQPPELLHPECLPIPVNIQDSFYGPLGVKCLEFLRSGAAPREDCDFGPREQLTQVTSYLDASTVYSSNAFQSDTLRLFRNGLLQYGRIQSRRPLLPRQVSDLCKRGSLSTSCFRAGDGRLSEQPGLTSLHVVFLRLHNRIATKLAALNFHWSDEKLFQETRRIVGAIVQHITYREFLPIVLGQEVMKVFDLEILKKGYYEAYDTNVNPTIANGFSTAAFRFGHSLVQHSFVRYDGHHKPLFNNVSIHDEFSNPVNLETAGSVDRLLLGLVNQPAQRRDEFISEELTNHLFQTPRFPFGMDLASLNIQRGRDHGIPPYVTWREPCGLSPIRGFEDLSRVMSASAARKFRLLYTSVEDIDLFPAGLAENSVAGGLVGPTFACIIGQQFSNLRRGDRFWYENPGKENSFTPGQLQQIRRVTLAQILCRTMDNIETIQPFVFLTEDTLKNEHIFCDDPSIGQLDLEFWAERPAEFRNNEEILEKANRKAGAQSKGPNSRPNTKGPNITKFNPGIKEETKFNTQRVKPVKANIHQQNKIVVRRPVGGQDNVTIVVQNNAVNSPVFVNDAIYGSHVINPPMPYPSPSTLRPIYGFIDQRPIHQDTVQSVQGFPIYNPPAQQIPTSIPFFLAIKSGSPYVPHAFDDPSNPNPLSQGFQAPNNPHNQVLFESLSMTSPKPPLYTYYTNGLHKPTTRKPVNDPPPSNYKPQGQLQDTESVYVSPTPATNSWMNLEPNYEFNNQGLHKPAYGASSQSQLHNEDINKPDNWNQFQQQFKPNNQQGDSGNWNSQGYQNRPNKPTTAQSDSGSWHSQDYPNRFTKRPYQDDSDTYQQKPNAKPSDQNGYSTTWSSVSSHYTGTINKPEIQHDAENEPGYQIRPSKRPIQADPDGWSTLPTYHKESVKPASYQDAGAWTNFPSYQSDSTGKPSTSEPFPSYHNRPSIKPIIAQDINKFSSTSSYQDKPSFSTESNWPSSSNNPYQQSSSTTNSFDELPSTHNHQRPTNQYTSINNNRPQAQSDPTSFMNPQQSYQRPTKRPSAQNDNRINVHLYTLGPIKRPINLQNDPGINQSYNRPVNKPPGSSFDKLSDNLPHQSPYPASFAEDFQSYKKEATDNAKPAKVHSVTIVTETIETISQSSYASDRIQNKVTTEFPRPLLSQVKDDYVSTRRPGQYYYEQNILRRYPDTKDNNEPRNTDHFGKKSEGNKEEDVDDKSTVKLELDPHEIDSELFKNVKPGYQVIGNNNEMNHHLNETGDDSNDDADDDLEGAFSEDVATIALSDSTNDWLNPEEDSKIPLMLDMPKIPSQESTPAKELPKPIKLRTHSS